MSARRTDAQRLAGRHVLNGECWDWTGPVDADGYGRARHGQKAHRLAYTVHIGPIPAGLCVCHRCDNRRCINPAHLFLGTHTENMADAARKGRGRTSDKRGTNNPHAKLDAAKVTSIRSMLGAAPQSRIGAAFGVSQSTVSDIARGRAWATAEG